MVIRWGIALIDPVVGVSRVRLAVSGKVSGWGVRPEGFYDTLGDGASHHPP